MKIRSYRAKIEGIGHLFFGRYVTEEKTSEETHDQYEERTWRHKVYTTKEGQCYLSPFSFKNGLESSAKWLSMKIPGEGKKTFTKRFTSGVMVTYDLLLRKKVGGELVINDVTPRKLFVPSDGRRGSGRRVFRIFPSVDGWSSEVEITISDNKITDEVLYKHIETLGRFIGLGSMRVENGGVNGRFLLKDLEMTEEVDL